MLSIKIREKNDPGCINKDILNETGWYRDSDIEPLIHLHRIKDSRFSTIPIGQTSKKHLTKVFFNESDTVFACLTREKAGLGNKLRQLTGLMVQAYENDPGNQKRKRTFIAVCNITGDHFFLVAINTSGEFLYVDTLGGDKLYQELQASVKPIFGQTFRPLGLFKGKFRQANNSDCGAWTTSVARMLVTEADVKLLSHKSNIKSLEHLLTQQNAIHQRKAHASRLMHYSQYTIPGLNYANSSLVCKLLAAQIKEKASSIERLFRELNCFQNELKVYKHFIKENGLAIGTIVSEDELRQAALESWVEMHSIALREQGYLSSFSKDNGISIETRASKDCPKVRFKLQLTGENKIGFEPVLIRNTIYPSGYLAEQQQKLEDILVAPTDRSKRLRQRF